ncbi:SPOR domain-containing protein [Hydrogenovibrio kuenenii]|uniref:SPOR domain-containing protein n=1 Tax=Hydrogenovibrio kuenenii TaxID=63658 RepID=UPI000467ADF9|nr:SPOR domain-containing protein [Hydrogenovibrio kuenenii]
MLSSFSILSAHAAEAPLYYDPVSGKYVRGNQLVSNTSDAFLVDVKVGKLQLGQLNVIKKNDGVWTSLKQLITVLNFPIDLTTKISGGKISEIKASGWFIRPDHHFSIQNLKDNTWQVNAKGHEFNLTEKDVWVHNEQLWVKVSPTLNWFDIKSDMNLLRLSLTLKSSEPLPIQVDARLKNKVSDSVVGNLAPKYARQDIPYQLIGPVFADIQLSGTHNKLDQNTGQLSLLGAGDLAYMTGRYFVGTSYNSSLKPSQVTNFRLGLERYSLDNDLLGPMKATQVEVGDLVPTQISNLSATNEVGVRVSNRPYGHVTNTQTVNIVGFQQPGWQVELYRNGIYLSTTQVSDNGQYQFFDQSLSVGKNEFKLLFYGPQGQREEKTQTYDLDPASLVGGKWIYDLSVSQQNTLLQNYVVDAKSNLKQDEARINMHAEKGLGLNASFTFDASSYSFLEEKQRHQFIQPGIRLFLLDTLLHAQWLKDVNGGYLGSFGLSRKFFNQQFSYLYQAGSSDFRRTALETASIEENHSVSLSGPIFRTRLTGLNYGLNYQKIYQFNNTEVDRYGLGLGLKLWRVSLSNNINYLISQSPQNKNVKTADGNFQASTYFYDTFWRTGMTYDIKPENKAKRGYFSVQKYFTNSFNTDLTLNRDFQTEYDYGQLSLNWHTRHFISSLQFQGDQDGFNSAYFSIRFGLGKNPVDNSLFMTSQSASTRGAAAAFVFEDANNNHRYDPGEKPIKNATFISPQTHREDKTDAQGVALISGLYPNMVTDLKLEPSSLPDPFWIPTKDGVSFLPRPGMVKTVLIPVVTSGEVEGTTTIVKQLSSFPEPLGQVPMVLTSTKTKKEFKAVSAYDGYFSIDTIPPGNYTLNVDKKFLAKNGLKSRDDMPIVIGAKGTLIVGAHFRLYPKEIYSYSKDKPTDNTGYAVDLGHFSSEKNARTALQALRSVFPSVLGGLNNSRPYQMLLSKNADETYQLILGPFDDINRPKYLCENLARSSLYCRVLTDAVRPAATNDSTETQPTVEKVSAKKDQPQVTPKNFTIQLLTTGSRQKAQDFINKYDLKDAVVKQKEVSGKHVYSVLVGGYETRLQAIKASKGIAKLTGLKPWVRRVSL